MKHLAKLPLWLLTLAALMSGWPTLTFAEPIPEVFARLGLSRDLAVLLGASKLVGAVGLHMYRWPRVRQWAQAGFVYLFGGAVVLHLAAGDTLAQMGAPLMLFALALWCAFGPDARAVEATQLQEAHA